MQAAVGKLPSMEEELERFVPGMQGPIWCEHWHRYHFVAPLAAGKVVVDAACGEGYGAALLASSAARVTGVDASGDTVARARRRYGGAGNLEFLEGRCEALPVADASTDLLVSFETMEHLQAPGALVAEAARVLRAEGVFIVSTPNKAQYTDATGYHNPFHPSELYESEFVAALGERFASVALFGQRVDAYSAIWPLAGGAGEARLLQSRANDAQAAVGLPAPLYFIALCAQSPRILEAINAPFSLLADRDHRVFTEAEGARREMTAMRAHLDRIEAAYLESQKRLAALLQERDGRTWPKPR